MEEGEAETTNDLPTDGQDDDHDPKRVWKKTLSDLDMDSELESDELGPVQEEMVAQVMKWLEQEITISPPSLQETEFVTINGDEETCGSSFSGTTSTVMASVDTRCVYVAPYLASTWPFAVGEPAPGLDVAGALPSADGEDEWMEFIIPDGLLEMEGLK
ncbi:hypothetical protein LUZ60_009310 [Juncus effusus]|nr:hypothetical protein LUZ60_009310 [Juncus effusus]